MTETMFVDSPPYVRSELAFLRSRSDWKRRWRPAIREARVGDPIPYLPYPMSSGTLIHHAYHLAKLEEASGLAVDQMATVFEFGGGYGSMARLLSNLGFSGRYLIIDSPAFSALQTYYLKTLGLTVNGAPGAANAGIGVTCLSREDQLSEHLPRGVDANRSMFIGTWSVSECPVDTRERILARIRDFGAVLIGYQGRFGEVDNTAYFRGFAANNPQFTWDSWAIEHIPGNRYLIGWRPG